MFTEDQDAEDPTEYVVPAGSPAIDLGPAVREELILAVPGYSVCGEDCRGLCPQCGADRNTRPCECRPPVDERWAVLEALKTKPEE